MSAVAKTSCHHVAAGPSPQISWQNAGLLCSGHSIVKKNKINPCFWFGTFQVSIYSNHSLQTTLKLVTNSCPVRRISHQNSTGLLMAFSIPPFHKATCVFPKKPLRFSSVEVLELDCVYFVMVYSHKILKEHITFHGCMLIKRRKTGIFLLCFQMLSTDNEKRS